MISPSRQRGDECVCVSLCTLACGAVATVAVGSTIRPTTDREESRPRGHDTVFPPLSWPTHDRWDSDQQERGPPDAPKTLTCDCMVCPSSWRGAPPRSPREDIRCHHIIATEARNRYAQAPHLWPRARLRPVTSACSTQRATGVEEGCPHCWTLFSN
jgi:hypothetical protein